MITNICMVAIIFSRMAAVYPAVPADAKLITQEQEELSLACCKSDDKNKPGDCGAFLDSLKKTEPKK